MEGTQTLLAQHREKVILGAFVRLFVKPDNDTVELCVINPTARRRWSVSRVVARILLEAARVPQSHGAVVSALEAGAGLTRDEAKSLVEALLSGGVLVAPDGGEQLRTVRALESWSSAGWSGVVDYHIATFDYPFVDYANAREGRKDIQLMTQYSSEDPDTDRARVFAPGCPRARSVSVGDALNLIEHFAEFGAAFSAQSLTALLAASLGVRGTRPTQYPKAANLLLKTVPSGGARHPTECYVVANSVADLHDGTYYFSSVDSALVPMTQVDARPMTCADNPRHGVTLLLSSKTARNRYRYREPRTFRTIFLDVGHIIANISAVARRMNFHAVFNDDIDAEAWERHLGLDRYQECVLYEVKISGAVTNAANTPDIR